MVFVIASVCLSLTAIGMGISCRERVVSLYYVVGILFALLWLPQVIRQVDQSAMDGGAGDGFAIMAILCTVASLVGYGIGRSRLPKSGRLSSSTSWRFGLEHLPVAATVMTAVGFASLGLLMTLPEDQRNERSPEGDIVMIAFLSKSIEIAFAFCYVGIRRGGGRLLWILLLIDAIFVGYRVLFIAKRSVLAEMVFVIIAAEWFVRRRAVPIWLAIVLVAAPPVVLSVGALYRRGVESKNGQWGGRTLASESIGNGFRSVRENLGSRMDLANMAEVEAVNAKVGIAAKKRTGDYNFGSADINTIIRMILPRQVFGDIRELFLLPGVGSDSYRVFGFVPKKGTPPTGFATAFEAFGYFGSLLFMVFGYLIARIQDGAERGSIVAQAVYGHVIFAVVNAFTHSTNRFPIAGLRILVLVLPAFLIATVLVRRAVRTGRRPVPPSG